MPRAVRQQRNPPRYCSVSLKPQPWMTNECVANLLHRLDHSGSDVLPPMAGRRRKSNRRIHDRIDYRQFNVSVIIEHPGGSSAQFLVCTRNISVGGLAFLHGGFVHPGSRCKIALPQLNGQHCALLARVVSCRAIDGFVHEIGIKFQHQIDPFEFVRPAQPESDEEVKGGQNAKSRVYGVARLAQQALGELRTVIEPPDLTKARSICMSLRAEALALESHSLSHAASSTLNALDRTASVAKAVTHLTELIAMCERLSADPTEPA
jgi:hypothetical protein